MVSTLSWSAATRYALPPLAAGLVLARPRPRLAIPLLAAAATTLLFFRDPARDPATPRDPRLVYASADGLITHVTLTAGQDGQLVISTYLSLCNVHVTRSPVTGTLTSWDHHHGRTGLARSPQAAARNRQARLTIDTGTCTVDVTLIAGAAARRISAWVTPGDHLAAGRKLGIIHFGSRTNVTLPASCYDPLVLPGDRATAGITPIARLRARPRAWQDTQPAA